MSWLRNSPLRASFSKRRPSTSPPKDCDPTACYNSFCKHWQQVSDIIDRTQPPQIYPTQDDVVGVVNHMGQMATLLSLETRPPSSAPANESSPPPSSCLDYMLSENLLERIFNWSLHAGRFGAVLRLEQLKLFELLSSGPSVRGGLLAQETFLKPLLALLSACVGECFPGEVEHRVVVLLNQLCVSLVHDAELLHKFFSVGPESDGSRFVVFSLLVPFVHREGSLGQQARDALLLCMALSATDGDVAAYISTRSNVCPVLATGLSGLYSRLPRKLDVTTDDWHRLTPDDVDSLPELSAFLNSVEFCNAVVQVAHPDVGTQLLEFVQQGFLVPVLGPALLQSSAEELVAATAYLDLCLRSVTEPGLLGSLIRFLLCHQYDATRLLDSLIARIASPSSRLCLVTLALFETLADLDCEDIMLELALRYLVPCHHVMVSQRVRVRDLAPYCQSAARFLSLSPVALRGGHLHPEGPPSLPPPSRPPRHHQSRPHSSFSEGPHSLPPVPPTSLYGDFHAYLRDARRRVLACRAACRAWAHAYDGEDPSRDVAGKIPPSTQSVTNGQCTDTTTEPVQTNGQLEEDDQETEHGVRAQSEPTKRAVGDLATRRSRSEPRPLPRSLSVTSSPPDVGPFLDTLLRKLETMPSNGLYVNLHLTGLVSRLAVYPQPLLHSFLLNHSLVFQPSVRSLFQVLGSLKHRIDAILSKASPDWAELLVAEARDFLLAREERLANVRRAGGTLESLPASNAFSRGEGKRRSFTSTLSSVFRRAGVVPGQVMGLPSIRHYQAEESNSLHNSNPPTSWSEAGEMRAAAMSAVVLDEWLKELAAITQEQALAGLAPDLTDAPW